MKKEKNEPVQMEKYEIQNAYDTLKKAEEIKQDPALMKKIDELIKKDKKSIRSLEDLKKVSKDIKEDEVN